MRILYALGTDNRKESTNMICFCKWIYLKWFSSFAGNLLKYAITWTTDKTLCKSIAHIKNWSNITFNFLSSFDLSTNRLTAWHDYDWFQYWLRNHGILVPPAKVRRQLLYSGPNILAKKVLTAISLFVFLKTSMVTRLQPKPMDNNYLWLLQTCWKTLSITL